MCDAFLVLANTDRIGISCFLVPRWRPNGTRNNLYIQRMKDKLGNKSNASTEMEFQDTYGVMVGEEGRGIRTIIEMVTGNRLYCAMSSAGIMRQALVQALHHTTHRSAFQKRLIQQPLMQNVLADMAVEVEAALMISLAHVLLTEELADRAFLDQYTVGFDNLATYLTGKNDGVAKTAEWAANICALPADTIPTLTRRMAKGRTMISVAWALTRQNHGEQPFWLGTVLAAMLGQIGLPGGGIGFGYGATNTVGLERASPRFQALRQGLNKVKTFIPVARITDLLENPGGSFNYNGKTYTYPDTRLVWWAGGNPFHHHHHQDLNRLRRAWARPETVIVNDWCWNALAQHADIVLPCTTPLERDDINLSPRDPYLVMMDRSVPPAGQARDDYDIFRGIAQHLGIEEKYTEGRDAGEWIRWLYDTSCQSAARSQVGLPPFD